MITFTEEEREQCIIAALVCYAHYCEDRSWNEEAGSPWREFFARQGLMSDMILDEMLKGEMMETVGAPDFLEEDASETQRLMRLYYLVDSNLLPSDRSEWEMKASSRSSLHFDYTYEELKDEYVRLLNNKEKCDD